MEGPRAGTRMGVVAAASGLGGSGCDIAPGSEGRAPTDPRVPPCAPRSQEVPPCAATFPAGGSAWLLGVFGPWFPALGGSRALLKQAQSAVPAWGQVGISKGSGFPPHSPLRGEMCGDG